MGIASNQKWLQHPGTGLRKKTFRIES